MPLQNALLESAVLWSKYYFIITLDPRPPKLQKKIRIRETQNLSTDADSITNIFVSAGVEEGAESNFVC